MGKLHSTGWSFVGFVLASCATPYQGSYRDKVLQPGVFLVEVQVNEYTSSGTAMEYLHRRSRELCLGAEHDGYRFADRTGNVDHSYYANQYGGISEASKHEMSAVVECTRADHTPVAAEPKLHETQSSAAAETEIIVKLAAGQRGWFCDSMQCARTEEACIAVSRGGIPGDGRGKCRMSPGAFCLAAQVGSMPAPELRCYPAPEQCEEERTGIAALPMLKNYTGCYRLP